MPEMIVWPVSVSSFTRNVGSSSAILPSAKSRRSLAAALSASIACEITGS